MAATSTTRRVPLAEDGRGLLALGLALSAFDAAATWMWLSLGIGAEANPLLAALVATHGATAAMGLRALLGAVWCIGFALLTGRTRLAHLAQRGTVALLATVATWHLTFGLAHAGRLLG